jgi:hypothetical protein
MIASDYDIGEVTDGGPPEFIAGKHELNGGGLTAEQEKYYRNLIDNPPAGKTADQARFERYLQAAKNEGRPPLPESKWKTLKDQLEKNRKFGIEQENRAREGVKKFTGRDLKNNNAGEVFQPTVKDPKSGRSVATRPDSVASNAESKIDLVHDHKTVTGSDKVVYETEQIRAQKQLVAGGKGDHIVSISTDKPKFTKIPPEPRPSGPLANRSQVVYTTKEGLVTHTWVVDIQRKGGGYWKKIL